MHLTEQGIITPTSIYSCQRTASRSLPPIPRSYPISGERIAPNQTTRIAVARFYEGYLPAKRWVIIATIAPPQSRGFNRWEADLWRDLVRRPK